jgi:molecular chaperone GrpE
VSGPQDGDSREQSADAGPGARPAGPVAGEGTPPSPGGEPTPTPPAGEAPEKIAPGQADQAADAGSSKRVEQDFDALLADTQRERDEYLDLAKRTKADFENYRKRMTAEVQAAANRGKAELVAQLIDAVDNLERALHSAGIDPNADDPLTEKGNSRDVDDLAHGVLLVFLGLRETLGRNGVETVDPTGEKFDPNLHEALSTVAADGAEAGTVVETMQKGYRLGDQLVRPARVVVAE